MLKNLTDEQKHIRLDEQEHIRLLWQLGCDLRSSIDGFKHEQMKMRAKIEAMQRLMFPKPMKAMKATKPMKAMKAMKAKRTSKAGAMKAMAAMKTMKAMKAVKAIKDQAMKTSNSGAMTADGANGVVEVYRVL